MPGSCPNEERGEEGENQKYNSVTTTTKITDVSEMGPLEVSNISFNTAMNRNVF